MSKLVVGYLQNKDWFVLVRLHKFSVLAYHRVNAVSHASRALFGVIYFPEKVRKGI